MNKVIKAKRLPIDPGPPAWREILPKQKDTRIFRILFQQNG